MLPNPIIAPPFQFVRDSSISLSFGESDARLLFFKTYFDRVAVAPININFTPFFTSSILEQTLVQQRELAVVCPQRLVFQELNPEFIGGLTSSLYAGMNERQAGQWALAPHGQVGDWLSSEGHPAMYLALERCLPAPRPDVQLHEVIDFRLKHEDLVRRLHHHIDVFTLSISAGANPGRRLELLADELKDVVGELQAAFERERVPFGLVTLKPSFQVPGEIITALGGGLAGMAGVPVPLGLLAGAFLSIGIKLSKVPRATNQLPRNFEFIAEGFREGILQNNPDSAALFENHYDNMMVREIDTVGYYPPRLKVVGRMTDGAIANIQGY